MSRRTTFLWFSCISLSLTPLVTQRAEAVVSTFTDFNLFEAASGASAQPAMPSSGDSGSQVVGDMTFTSAPPSSLNFGSWTSFMPGFELAINQKEDFNVSFADPLDGLGFNWLDVNDPQNTSFTIDFFSNGSSVASSTFTSNGVENTSLFQGFTTTEAFDRVEIREVGNDFQNEFFGRFYTSVAPPPVININTNTGTITGDGDGDPNAAYGVPFTTSITGGIRTFAIAGDLTIPAMHEVVGVGSLPTELLVGGDVTIGAGASFDFSANGIQAGPGGGKGGAPDTTTVSEGGSGGAQTGTPAAGGPGGTGGIPGFGGAAGTRAPFGGAAGSSGTAGEGNSSQGGVGASGVNSSGSGGNGGNNLMVVSGGIAGNGGDGGCNVFSLGVCTGGGAGGGGGSGVGGNGFNGMTGDSGNDGTPGGDGAPGRSGQRGSNTGTTLLSGGGGGGAGANGASGGGGGSGGGGAGGGGGGGGGGLLPFEFGASGGSGGAGGIGALGGNGGKGGVGGEGGGGGGALAIIAHGRLTIAGELSARGADGEAGEAGVVGTAPAGQAGLNGGGGVGGGPNAGDGGTGGRGGNGGDGGKGGDGGDGGDGGGGGGGSIWLAGSVTDTSAATVDVTAGTRGTSNTNTAGKFRFGSNVATGYEGSLLGTGVTQALDAPRDANPFISGTPHTPFIPGLVGGAETYGLTDLFTETDLADVVNAAPAGALAALVYEDVGRAGFNDDYSGFDMLAVLNLSGDDLPDLMFGAGNAGFESGLLTGGVANNANFGGDGVPDALTLEEDGVYITLVPEGTMDFNLSAMGFSTSMEAMTDGSVLFLVAGLPGDYNGDDSVDGADYAVWRNNLGAPVGTLLNDSVGIAGEVIGVEQYNAWRANFGATMPAAAPAGVPVPEPSAVALLASLIGLGFSRRQA